MSEANAANTEHHANFGGKLRFSMNGFRRNLSADIEALRDIVQAVAGGEYYSKSDLIDAMNQVIGQSNALNCVYLDGDKDFANLEHIEVDLIPVEDE